MPLLIVLAIVTITLSGYLAFRTRQAFWARASLGYAVLALLNLALALGFWVWPQPVRTLMTGVLLIATLFLFIASIFGMLRLDGDGR